MKKYQLNPGELGHGFEAKAKQALQGNHYACIEANKVMKNLNLLRDSADKREYDLVMFNWLERQVYIVECKAHFKKETPTQYAEVREFKEKLDNFNGSFTRRMIITNTYFTRAALDYALGNRIIPVNGQEFARIERHSKSIKGRAIGLVSRKIVEPMIEQFRSAELEGLIVKLMKNYST